MRKGRALVIFLLDFAMVFCALLLVVAFVSVGTGLLAILALFVALLVVHVRGFARFSAAPVFARRAWRFRSSRAPPRF